MNSSLRSRSDWRMAIVATTITVTLAVLLWTLPGWHSPQPDEKLSGITTGISPANTVYPPRVR